MGRTNKKKKQRRKELRKRYKKKREDVDEEILSSISDPNPWTPEKEDAWLKQPAHALRKRFPPMTKPMHVKRRKSGSGWGDI